MYKSKTTETDNSVVSFIETIQEEQKQKDSFQLVELMSSISSFPAKMWGSAIIGFGSYHYQYESGHEGDAPLIGFSPRKSALSIYVSCAFPTSSELLSKLGKHKMSKACLYIKYLKDVDLNVLEDIVRQSLEYRKTKNC